MTDDYAPQTYTASLRSAETFTLHDVTGAMGEALRRRPPEWHVAHEREIRLFVDDTIAILRASAAHAGREYEASSASLTTDPSGR